MERRISLWGLRFGFVWLVVGLICLYMIARFSHEAPNLKWFCLIWLLTLPPLAGFRCGWLHAASGFMAGASVMPTFLLALAIFWWWLWPDLWSFRLWLCYSFYALALTALCGGLGGGFRLAYDKLYPQGRAPDKTIPPIDDAGTIAP